LKELFILFDNHFFVAKRLNGSVVDDGVTAQEVCFFL
jgi:hypothetical protein